ncbi:MAG: hypothetical protein H0X67_01550 [Acidobacteria bacterium]|nr:hypothetical protein [Acidobacteriota bacterium]
MSGRPRRTGLVAFALCLPAFVLLCTVNSAGYRYGASDQAFYVPAVLEHLDPTLFPRDDALISAQAGLTRTDETLAAVVRASGAELPIVYAILYVVSLTLLGLAGWLLARQMYRSEWAAVALLAALTLRHAIAHSGTNTLEAYFHPRQLAFALGALGIAAFLRGRLAGAVALVLAAAFLHPTTALWFALWLGMATVVAEQRLRIPLAALAGLGTIAGLWALTAGPLAGRLVIMDSAWIATLETKDYLFTPAWPLDAWFTNLAYIPIIVLLYRRRVAGGLASEREHGVVAGCLALVVLFLASLPFVAGHVALAVQMQTGRIFWMLDFLAVIYAVWWLAEGAALTLRRAQAVAFAIVLASTVRGAYVMTVVFPDRSLAQVDVRDDDWGKVMAWTRGTPPESGLMADPQHAARYGTSVRVAGERDVLVEAVKDTAIGMYSRDIAMRTRERIDAVGDFATLTPARARRLAERYGLDYLVTEQELALPTAFQSGALRVYRLRDPLPATGAAHPPR